MGLRHGASFHLAPIRQEKSQANPIHFIFLFFLLVLTLDNCVTWRVTLNTQALPRATACLPATVRCASWLVLQASFIFLGLSLCGAEVATSKVQLVSSAFRATTIQLKVAPLATHIDAEWHYTNRWDFPLLIERIDQSCSCLSSTHDAEKATPLAPGATGTLRARFTPGAHRGLLRKSLHVRFVGHEKPVELVAEATIPSHVELSAQDLVWPATASTEAKSIDVTSGTGQAFKITSLQGLAENQFTVTPEVIKQGTHYRIVITPKASAAGQHCLQVRTDSPDSRDSLRAVFLRVDPPTP